MPGIVVGVNGSPNSEAALDWAMGHAAALRVPITVIAVHEVPKSYWGNIPVVGPPDTPLLDEVHRAADELTRQAASRLGDAQPATVEVRAVSGFVVKQLLDASRDADLLVLGMPHSRAITRAVMGSVSHEVLQHSPRPVVIVPPLS